MKRYLNRIERNGKLLLSNDKVNFGYEEFCRYCKRLDKLNIKYEKNIVSRGNRKFVYNIIVYDGSKI